MKNNIILYVILFQTLCFSQTEIEINQPFNIKTVCFSQNNQNSFPFFQLGDAFQFQFDDLFGNEVNYFYTINLCDYDWKPSELSKNEYLQGFDDQRITDYTNSFNTLQIFSHYHISFPNQFTAIKLSGNYIIKIFNEEKDLIFSRKFILFENIATVPLQVRRARKSEDLNTKQNLDFSIKSSQIQFQDPAKNVNVLIVQNGKLNNALKNVKPQYTLANDLIYRYDSDTQFWGGNEFLYFDSKEIRVPSNMISYVDSNAGIYNSHLYINKGRAFNPYTFNPDINGNFVIRRLNAENNLIEADYSWVFFTLYSSKNLENKDVYVNGMFNNYTLNNENKMEYNADKGVFEKALMIKQGFTNYQYVTTDKNGKIDSENAIDGNFYQTENNYTILVYYRANGQRYDRIIGKGDASSVDIIN
jgi:hypothetical protein